MTAPNLVQDTIFVFTTGGAGGVGNDLLTKYAMRENPKQREQLLWVVPEQCVERRIGLVVREPDKDQGALSCGTDIK